MLDMAQEFEEESRIRRRSLKGYVAKVLKETSLSGIISAKSTCQKGFKTSVFLFSFIGFFYQTWTFIEYILGYPTIINIQILLPEEAEVPAFTFCNSNGISRKKFCGKYPDRCEVAEVQFCFNSDCEVENTLVPKKEYHFFANKIEVEEFVNLSYPLNDLLSFIGGEWNSVINKPPVQGPILRAKSGYGYGRVGCYTIHSLVESKGTPAVTQNHRTLFLMPMPIITFRFDVQKKDVFLTDEMPGLMFEIHSPYLAVNPFIKGILMRPGRTYNIYLTPKLELLQPYPYDTDCINYTDIWLSRNKTGPRIQEMCIQNCFSELEMFSDCLPPFVVASTSKKICDLFEYSAGPSVIDDAERIYKACLLTCKKDCRKLTYTQVVQEQFTAKSKLYNSDISFTQHLLSWIGIVLRYTLLRQNDAGDNLTEMERNGIFVDVYFDAPEVTVVEHRPQFQDIEVFSYIGGFIGVWLGMSLIQLSDFLEAAALIVSFYFKRKKNDRVNTLNVVMNNK